MAASLDILGGQGVQADDLARGPQRGMGIRSMFIPINPQVSVRALRWLRRFPYLRTMANQALYVPSLARLAGADVVHVFSASYWSFLLGPVPAMAMARVLSEASRAPLSQR